MAEESSGREIVFHDDGTVTEQAFGPAQEFILTPELLRPWLVLAQHILQREQGSACVAG